MNALKAIPQLVLAALLLVLLPLWANPAPAAPARADGLSLLQARGLPGGEAVLHSALQGISHALRRGDEAPPHGPGSAAGGGLLPAVFELPQHAAIRGPQVWQTRPIPAFVRMQEKLLFPKHWFW